MVNVMRYKWIADAEGPAQCQTRPFNTQLELKTHAKMRFFSLFSDSI